MKLTDKFKIYFVVCFFIILICFRVYVDNLEQETDLTISELCRAEQWKFCNDDKNCEKEWVITCSDSFWDEWKALHEND